MARRRMFSLDVVDTDRFLDMPASTQALYFHLGMRADDDGFVASPKKTTALVGCNDDDLKLLLAKGYVVTFSTGVLVITDWAKNNYIQKDRYTPTQFQAEKALIDSKKGECIQDDVQDVYISDTQERKGEERKEKKRVKRVGAGKPPKREEFVPPSKDEAVDYFLQIGGTVKEGTAFYYHYATNGWVQGKGKGRPIKNWQAAAGLWLLRKSEFEPEKQPEKQATNPLDVYLNA